MLVPLRYNLRSLLVRRSSTALTVVGIAATVAVVAGVMALQQGFARMYSENGSSDIFIFLRPGATYEGYSMFPREGALKFIKTEPEIAQNEKGEPLAAMECFSAIRLFKSKGGETNVPVRGVQPKTLEIRGDSVQMTDGRMFTTGSDEVVVGRRLLGRVPNLNVGDVVQINVTPFRIVGTFECPGPSETEIWGDFDRIMEAMERFGPNRMIARLKGVSGEESSAATESYVAAFADKLASANETPAKVLSEREYLTNQTELLSAVLLFLSGFLGIIMGLAAVFTATNTMLSAIAARTHEIGILLACGFRPVPIFLSFLFEALLLGLLGGLIGCLLTIPINGIETGTTNFQTFTEVAFSFKITPFVLGAAVMFSVALGLLGGAWPALKAARSSPTEALRRR